MSLRVQDSGMPQRRLSVLFKAAGGVFAFIASILGALMLASMSGLKVPLKLELFLAHPYLQIFGFLTEFICGIAYSTVPLFKSRKGPNPNLSYTPFSRITQAY